MIVKDELSLRIPCVPVLPEEINDLRYKLETALLWSEKQGKPGVGLACPQIGIGKNMAIIRIDNSLKLDLVNVKITNFYHPFEFDGEECLSFPDLFVKTIRYQEIVIQNNLVSPNSFVLTGFISVVAQHEYDHLQARLLPDFISHLKK